MGNSSFDLGVSLNSVKERNFTSEGRPAGSPGSGRSRTKNGIVQLAALWGIDAAALNDWFLMWRGCV
jgi:hypothetical protein